MFGLMKLGGNGKAKRLERIKDKVLKNREGVLGVISESVKGARQCPFLLGSKCLGSFCEFFHPYVNTDDKTKKKFKYNKCVFSQIPFLQMELISNIRKSNELLEKLLKRGA